MTVHSDWETFANGLIRCPSLGMSFDLSRMGIEPKSWAKWKDPVSRAIEAMRDIEGGAIANRDEQRMVGHYWLRDPSLAPSAEIRSEIVRTIERIRNFALAVHTGKIVPASGGHFTQVLLVGIGGSALGPQFVCDALRTNDAPMSIHFLDNTDPDGFDRTLDALELPNTLVLVISKSGGTKETRNGMLEVSRRFEQAGLMFPSSAVAVTGEGSELDNTAKEQRWLERFPMWDWVGGRTSVTSAVGLLPAALCGIDVEAFLEGARDADAETRKGIESDDGTYRNPAAALALAWYAAGEGTGSRAMVVLPYKDRLAFLSRYLQQLVMESLGKALNRRGKTVHQGLTVYGNKGSTDQHAYVQQLREGPADFFVTFIEVHQDRPGSSMEVEPQVTSGDYLFGFLAGTREALSEEGRPSLTITIDDVSARSAGSLIAVFERAVGIYAELIDINAYHQPGVEAGKRAATDILNWQGRVMKFLTDHAGHAYSVPQICEQLHEPQRAEITYRLLMHLASNAYRRVVAQEPWGHPDRVTFAVQPTKSDKSV